MIPQPYQQQQGAGGIIHQRNVIKTAVNDPSIYGVLPSHCQAKIDSINLKGLADWTDDETAFMARMIPHALDC